jgi:hypothetical protein
MEANNMAAMREAVGNALWCLNWMDENTDNQSIKDHLAKPIELLTSALAAPPRNCDVGTVEEQSNRYETFCKSFYKEICRCDDCPIFKANNGNARKRPRCQIAWAQMPYDPSHDMGD